MKTSDRLNPWGPVIRQVEQTEFLCEKNGLRIQKLVVILYLFTFLEFRFLMEIISFICKKPVTTAAGTVAGKPVSDKRNWKQKLKSSLSTEASKVDQRIARLVIIACTACIISVNSALTLSASLLNVFHFSVNLR